MHDDRLSSSSKRHAKKKSTLPCIRTKTKIPENAEKKIFGTTRAVVPVLKLVEHTKGVHLNSITLREDIKLQPIPS